MIVLAIIYCVGALFTALDYAIGLPEKDRARPTSAAAAGTAIAAFWPLSWGVILALWAFTPREKA